MNENKENKKKNKSLKMAAITGAVVCTVAVSNIIGFFNNVLYNPQVYPENTTNSIVQEQTQDYGKESPNNNFSTQNNNDKKNNTSYNAFLYASDDMSLSSTIGIDTFGFAMSKPTDNADRRLEVGEYNPIEISISEESYNEFVRWVDSKDVIYVYEDLYNIDDVLLEAEKYQTQTEQQGNLHTDLITNINQIPSAKMLADKIKSNSLSYLSENKGYSQLNNSDIEKISIIIESVLKEYYHHLSEEDITRIYCMLNDIVAVGIDSTDFTVNELRTVYNARVTEDGVIMLDMNQIKTIRNEESLERTLAHEIGHLFQRMCPEHRINGYTQIGNSQYFDKIEEDEKINSLHFQWLYEAAAEQMSMDLYGAKTPIVYKNMVGYLHTLDLITLINPNYEQNSIAISQLSNNPEAIYEVFGAENLEEQKELTKMLFSICYIQTDREDFIKVYENEIGSIEGYEVTAKYIMKESIAQTMTKYFYKNLAERVANSDVTLQDTFYLINAFESALSLHLIYDDESMYEYNDEAIKYYIEVQDQFFERIATDSGYSKEEIIEKFNNYALVIQTNEGYQRNNSLSWLSQDEKDYIGTVITTNIQSLTTNIRNIDFIQNKNTK